MKRNLKALGLALAAMFAFGALSASAASAQEQGELTVDDGTAATLTVSETGEGTNYLEAFGSKVECPGSTYTGHEVGSTTKPVPAGATTATVTPHYKPPCPVSPGGFSATVNMTGCDYVFHIGTTTPAGNNAGTYGVTADVECPDGKSIDVTVWSGSNHGAGPICHLTVPQQTGLKGAHVTNGAESGTITGTFEKITVERSGFCLLDGKGSSTAVGKFAIDATITGHDSEGVPVGVTVTE